MTISLTVILIESTNEISLGLPIMLSLLVSQSTDVAHSQTRQLYNILYYGAAAYVTSTLCTSSIPIKECVLISGVILCPLYGTISFVWWFIIERLHYNVTACMLRLILYIGGKVGW